MSTSRLRSEELYRKVFERSCPADEPDWDSLNKHYSGRLGFISYVSTVKPVQPLNAMMYYIVDEVDKVWVSKVWPRDELSEDPSIACFDEPPSACD